MITASLVKELREKTGAGMMDCKKALTETAGDFEAAVDWLRTKGLAAAAKKAGRVAADGLVAVSLSDKSGAIIELNSETDFVARNDQFQALAASSAKIALEADDIEDLKSKKTATGKTLGEDVVEAIATIGENINLRRMSKVSVTQGVVVSYVHNQVVDGMGKICTLIALESDGDQEKLTALGKQLAMHACAARPASLNIADLDPALVQRERDIFSEQARESGKPENIIEKMVEGRVRKFYQEAVLLEQAFVMDGKTKIADVIAEFAKENGCKVDLVDFARVELGEGIEQEETDFAAEVAAVAGS